jgi:hypothetical protein
MQKNPKSSTFASQRWFNFAEASTQHPQPIGDSIATTVHSVKTFQGWYFTPPCGFEEDRECYLHDKYPVREVLYWWAEDLLDTGPAKVLKLPKTGARNLLRLIEKASVEPTTTGFTITRHALGNSYRYECTVADTDLAPSEAEVPDDLYELLLSWMSPEFQKRHVPYFDKLRPAVKQNHNASKDGSDRSPIDPRDPEV